MNGKRIWWNITQPLKKEWNNAICSDMDLETSILSEVSQKKMNIIWSHLYVAFKKTQYKWSYLQNSNRLTDFENKLMVTKGDTWQEEIK